MVVPDSNAGRTLVRPTKDNSPLVIDPNRMPASPASFQGFEFIAGRYNQVSEPFGGIYRDQFTQSDAANIGETSVALTLKEFLSVFAIKGQDHLSR
ncbi:MAG: hypothetical protein WCC08_01490 [Terrimicrobiaceae bacterium]